LPGIGCARSVFTINGSNNIQRITCIYRRYSYFEIIYLQQPNPDLDSPLQPGYNPSQHSLSVLSPSPKEQCHVMIA
ncbi:neuronal calcium sensor 2-like X3, partial [Biomphalaria glabrata]